MASDGLTEREKVMLQREGFVVARKDVCPIYSSADLRCWNELAATRFPLPKRTRPRQVSIPVKHYPSRQYRVCGGVLQYRDGPGCNFDDSQLTHAAVRALNDLLDNPDEEIPE